MLPILLYQHCSSCCLQLGVFREQAPNRQLRVFNQNGALIQTFDLGKAQEGHQLWDTRRVIPGVYVYDVYEGDRKVHAGKIVIQ